MCGDLLNLQKDIDLLEKYSMDLLHLDVMDLNFVPNLTLGFDLINRIKSTIPKDIHLMVKNVGLAVERLQTKLSDYITFHVESGVDIGEMIRLIKKKAYVGLAVSPETVVSAIYPYLQEIDLVLLMSVHPGFSGQKFIAETYQKAAVLSGKIKLLNSRQPLLGVDGGIGPEQIIEFGRRGAGMFVLGTSTLYKGDLEENLKKFSVFRKTFR